MIVVGVPLIPLLDWLADPPSSGPRYIRWPGRDGAHVMFWIVLAAFYVTLILLVPFGAVLTYRVGMYGPDNTRRRVSTAIVVGLATAILFFDAMSLLNYLANVSYLVNPD